MAFSITASCSGCTACARACPVAAIAGERGAVHRVDPARCIECGACGRLCPRGAVLDDRGAPVARLMPRTLWAKPRFELGRCISCGACADKCPAACIDMGPGKPGGHESWPSLARPERCVSCGWCAFYCPMACVAVTAPAAEPVAAAPIPAPAD